MGPVSPLVVPVGFLVLCVRARACAPVLLREGVVLACVPGSQGSPRPEGGGRPAVPISASHAPRPDWLQRWGGMVWLNLEKPWGAPVLSPRPLRRPHAWADPCPEALCGYACPSRPWREPVRSAPPSQFCVLEAVWAKGWPAVPVSAQAGLALPPRCCWMPRPCLCRLRPPGSGSVARGLSPRLEARELRKEAAGAAGF